MLNRTIAPEFKQVSDINFIHPALRTLDNGLPVYSVFSGEQDLVRIEFIFDNVNWDVSKPLQAIAANALLTGGTHQFSAKQIAERIDFYGAFLQTAYTQDHATVTLYTLSKYLPLVLPIVQDVLVNAQFPQSELDTYVRNQKQRLLVSLEKNSFLARKEFAHATFGETAYGVDIRLEHYKDLNQPDLVAYHKVAYTPNNCTVIVAGKFDDEAFGLLNEQFGRAWEKNDARKNSFVFGDAEKKDIFIEKPDSLQSAVRIGLLAVNRTHADFAGLQVVNCILGGYFGSRLMNNIREDKGYTYGIGSSLSSLQHAGYISIATEVGVDVCADALKEVYKEINLLRDERVGEGELELVKNFMLGSTLGSLENIFSHADKFKNIHFSGLDYSYYDKYISTVKTITADEVQQLAQKYLMLDQFTEVVVGKR
ncbi:zinc protease [Pedobacter sp. UYP30]|uniref:M16 family metallopeptidase n=1 Tax=Pedobacter sp. UYP30 TaxID=1756400 RepID=UPI0033986818